MYAKFNTMNKGEVDTDMSSVTKITSQEQRSEIIKGNTLVVVKNYTDWCGPCKQCNHKYAEMATRYNQDGRCILVNENVEDNIQGAQNVRGVPCFHFYVNGEFRDDATLTGADMDAVESMISTILNLKSV